MLGVHTRCAMSALRPFAEPASPRSAAKRDSRVDDLSERCAQRGHTALAELSRYARFESLELTLRDGLEATAPFRETNAGRARIFRITNTLHKARLFDDSNH